MAAPAQHSAEPERLYRIGDVSRLTDTKPFVLRFWETEFPMLQPVKTPKGHRLYRQEDIDLILAIKRLLYEEGFTIPGARRHLAEQFAGGPPQPAGASPFSGLVGADPRVRPALSAPATVGADPAAAADVSAPPGASLAAAPKIQPVLFPTDPSEQSHSTQAASLNAQQAASLHAVREELHAILTLLGTG